MCRQKGFNSATMIRSLFKSTHWACVSGLDVYIHANAHHENKCYIIYIRIENRLCKHCLRGTLDFLEALIHVLRLESIHMCRVMGIVIVSNFEWFSTPWCDTVDRMKQLASFPKTTVLLLCWYTVDYTACVKEHTVSHRSVFDQIVWHICDTVSTNSHAN